MSEESTRQKFQTSWKGIERIDGITDDEYKDEVVEFKLDYPSVSVIARTGGYFSDEKGSIAWRVYLKVIDERLENPIGPVCLAAFLSNQSNQKARQLAISAAECAARAFKVICGWSIEVSNPHPQKEEEIE